MKAILEQDFNELYAQVEERVKCIKPVKQIDTFTKALMWTSLNEILTDVFGESRFMWMISTSYDSFNVTFVDRYSIANTKSLNVKIVDGFVFPSIRALVDMEPNELKSFINNAHAQGFSDSDIDCWYGKNDGFIRSLIYHRSKGKRSNNKGGTDKRISSMRSTVVDRLTNDQKCELMVCRCIIRDDIPLSWSVMASSCNIEYDKIHKAWLSNLVHRKQIEYYWDLIEKEFVDWDRVDEIYKLYCQTIRDVTDKMAQNLVETDHIGVRINISRFLNVKHKQRFNGICYQADAQEKIKKLISKLNKIINNKGGRR